MSPRIALFSMLAIAMLARAPSVESADFDEFLKQHCVDCHGPQTQEADLRLDRLGSPEVGNLETWENVLEMVRTGDMPPQEATQPNIQQRSEFVHSISSVMATMSPPPTALRRLNRHEYEYTLHDLLKIETPLAPLLPEDGQVQGFDNVATGLGISSILMERYLEASNAAFEATIRRIKPAPPATRRALLMDLKDNQESVEKNKGGVIEKEGAFIDFTPGWPPARVDPAHPIEGGIYRCRVAVWPHDPGEHRTLSVAIFTGPLFGPGERKFHGMFDVTGTPDDPRIIEFTTKMEELHALHILPWIYPEHITYRDKEEKRPGVAIAWAETYGPLDQEFPSIATENLFGESSSIHMDEGWPIYMRHRKGVKSHFVDSTDPQSDLRRILTEFAPRAFRRPVDEELLEGFIKLALQRLDAGNTFEEAVGAGVSAILCSPHFLLLNAELEPDDYTLASRLSYFLWSSLPDDELIGLAEAGRLSEPDVRAAQVERMLADPKSDRFVERFTDQWLDLAELEFTTPDKKLYPEYDDLLLRSMLAETRGFFRHLLDNDLSVLNFVDSDFAILNQRMAEHYGISGIRGHEKFQVVNLPSDSVRGGILTHGSVLKVTANGTTTSPVIRGAWVLDKLLGQPAPPPPPGVPAVEPDIRGAVTIREQLALHRESESCARCHHRIDPPGFAMEEFDVIGGWRSNYRSIQGKGPRVAKTNYYHGLPVESNSLLSDGREFANFHEFRERLLEDPELVAGAIAEKLLVYGTGRPLSARHRDEVHAIVEKSREENFGLRSMIHAVTESRLFLED